ncbi:MAG: helix-turn-helix domain-containing protein [Candidatus Heimdallarchaeota archaeon]
MKLEARVPIIHVIVFLLVFWGILFPSVGTSILARTEQELPDLERIAIFYGSPSDKSLGESLIADTGHQPIYYNIEQLYYNSSLLFQNESIGAIWWINDLPLPIKLPVNIMTWKESGRGIFILNRFLHTTPIQILNQIGITTTAPVVYPLDGSYQNLNIQLEEAQMSSLNINASQTNLEFSGSSAWVELSNQTQLLAEIPRPELFESIFDGFKSGIWMNGPRVVIGSFALEIQESSIESSFFPLNSNSRDTVPEIVSVLRQTALLTMMASSNGNNALIEFGGLEQLAGLAILGVGVSLGFVLLVQTGIMSKSRDVIAGALLGTFFFIAHVTYSPQRRRMTEDELLDNDLRAQIMEYLEEKGEQGAHLREIQREIGCGISSLLWHLQALDDFNFVTHEKVGRYHIFYIIGEKSTQTSELALALKSNLSRELCRALMEKRKPMSLSQLSNEINAHHSSVQHHIRKLSELGVIIIIKDQKRFSYAIGSKHLTWLKDYLEVS